MDEQRKKRLIAKYSKSSAKRPEGSGGPGGPGGPRPGPGGGKIKVKKPQNTKKAIARLMGYLSEDKGRLIFVFFCVIAGTIANLAGSYMLRPIINGLTGEGSSAQKLLHSLLTMAGIYIIGVTAQYLQQRIMIGVSQGALEKIRNDCSRNPRTDALHERVDDNCDGCDGSAHDESGRSSGRKEPEILSGAAGSDRYFKRLYRRNDDGTEGCKGVLP